MFVVLKHLIKREFTYLSFVFVSYRLFFHFFNEFEHCFIAIHNCKVLVYPTIPQFHFFSNTVPSPLRKAISSQFNGAFLLGADPGNVQGL